MKSTPEPDVGRNKDEDELDTVAAVNHNVSSDEEDVDQQLDAEVNNGYQLMPGGVNGQFYFNNHDDDDSSSSESEDDNDEIEGDYQQVEQISESPSVSPERDMNVNEELILSTMKNITLSSVPMWAENLSCERWDMIVKQAIKKDPATNNTSTPTSSNS